MTKPFEGIFGDTVELRLFEFFMNGYDHGEITYSIDDLAYFIDSTVEDVRPVLPKLITWKIVTPIEGIGVDEHQQIKECYKVNATSTIMSNVLELNNALIGIILREAELIDEEQI